MAISRRGFVGGALAFGVGGRMSQAAASARGDTRPPMLRLGVVSDVHIGGKPDAALEADLK